MSILISTALVLLLIFPGLFFRYLLIQGKNRKIRISNIEQIYWAVIPAVFFHVVLIAIIYASEALPDPDIVGIENLLQGHINFSEAQLKHSGPWITSYYLASILFGAIMGVVLRKVFIATRLYKVHPLFEVDDKWVRLFTEKYITQNYSVTNELFISLDVVMVSDENKLVIYSGTLTDFFVDEKGELQNITLKDVFRRNLANDLENKVRTNSEQQIDERYYPVAGHLFLIEMSKVVNLNVTYMDVSVAGDALDP